MDGSDQGLNDDDQARAQWESVDAGTLDGSRRRRRSGGREMRIREAGDILEGVKWACNLFATLDCSRGMINS